MLVFQHTATRRWLGGGVKSSQGLPSVSTHSHPKVAGTALILNWRREAVSTHSHPKVAGLGVSGWPKWSASFQHTATRRWLGVHGRKIRSDGRFNTQPPEGGWLCARLPRRESGPCNVSTHSHPKVAGCRMTRRCAATGCFNTQPPEGGWRHESPEIIVINSFNTQPPEGGWQQRQFRFTIKRQFQHTATRRWLAPPYLTGGVFPQFQHTATRRWLDGKGAEG